MIKNLYFLLSCFCCLFMNCQNDPISKQEKTEIVGIETPQPEPQPQPEPNPDMPQNPSNIKILALGDSYTIGESVCETCRFPEQLKKGMSEKLKNALVTLNIVARTGWTTSSLKNAISNANLSTDHDLVTLLIGVNNQYQNQPFEMFQNEFPELANAAIQYAKGEKKTLSLFPFQIMPIHPLARETRPFLKPLTATTILLNPIALKKALPIFTLPTSHEKDC